MIKRQITADRRSQASEYVPRTPRWQAYSWAGQARQPCSVLAGPSDQGAGVVVSCADDRY